MFKIIVRTLMILLAAGLITAGLIVFVNNGGMNSLGSIARVESMRSGFPGLHAGRQDRFAAPPNGSTGIPNAAGRQHGMEGGEGFSLAGLSGVGLQLGKVALITALIVGAQAVIGLFRRRPQPAGNPAAASPADGTSTAGNPAAG